MAQNEYYPEDVLVGKMQSGEYGWLDYVNHFSADWQEEYARYCEEKGLAVGNESAAEFVRFKDEPSSPLYREPLLGEHTDEVLKR